jgi:hypothetical protein
MEQCCFPLAVEIVPGKHCDFRTYLERERELNLAHAHRCSFLIMEQCCGPLPVEIIPGKHCNFSTYLTKRVRTQSGACAEVQFPDYGTVLWSPCSRNGSRKVGNTAISAPILPRERELSLENAQRCSLMIMEQSCGPRAVDIVPGKHSDFSTYLTNRARAQSGACPEVQFSDNGTVLWSPGSRNDSRKALQFQHQSCQEGESSVWLMRRGSVS